MITMTRGRNRCITEVIVFCCIKKKTETFGELRYETIEKAISCMAAFLHIYYKRRLYGRFTKVQ